MVAIVSTEQLLKQSTTVDAREVHAEKMPQPWVWGGGGGGKSNLIG